jgi:hypothetical protein
LEGEPVTAAAFTGPSHHVALMRRAELVVQYRPGPELNNPAVEWTGVFRATPETDSAFADAEPPTHDDWRSALVVDGWAKRYVNVALREIKNRVNLAFGAAAARPETPQPGSGVLIADALGPLISSLPGTGASKPRRAAPEGGGGRRLTPAVRITRQWLELVDGSPSLRLEFMVSAASGSPATLVEVVSGAATADGALEHDPPVGAPVPVVEGFDHGGTSVAGSRLRLDASDLAPVVVTIRQPSGVAAAVEIKPTAEVSG